MSQSEHRSRLEREIERNGGREKGGGDRQRERGRKKEIMREKE